MDQPNTTDNQSAAPPEDASDFAWGAAAIGREIARAPGQVYHLYEIGALDGAVVKLGHRTLLGSRKQLRNIIANKLK